MNQANKFHSDRDIAADNPWEAARFLEKVTSMAPNVIYVFNQETQSNEYANRSVGGLLGYSEEEVIAFGADLMPKLCYPDDLARVAAHFEQLKTIKDGETIRLEYRMQHKAGHWVWLLSDDAVFERNGQGEVIRHLGIATDISTQKEAEEDALNEKRKAIATNDELRAFAYSVSHDLKAPSSTISLILKELIESHGNSLPDDAKTLIDMAQGTAVRMGITVDDVLSYTQMVEQELAPQKVELATMIQEVLVDLTAPIRASDAQIDVGDLPPVMADRLQMRVLFQNLIANAIKFHKPGQVPRVRVFAREHDHQQSAQITVADEGIGIAKEQQERVFQVFKRLHTAAQYEGTGLGLAICRRIAANHGSDIQLSSTPGEGSAFSVILPICGAT